MKILIISENFLTGGLERQLLTQKEALPATSFVYLFMNYKENDKLKDSHIYDLKKDNTVKTFMENVDKIITIIRDEEIDYIHVHPFHTIFPALFAAYITNTPVCCTVHGYYSINFAYQINDSVLLKYMLNSLDNPIFAVSKIYKDVIESSYNRCNVKYLPNCIDTNIFEGCKYINNRKWVLISRLDKEKEQEILLLIKNMKKLGIQKLDIAGTGDAEENIKAFVGEKNEENVRFLGYCSNITKVLKNSYNGVIGFGQVVLEGLSANLPVLLIGDGRITGLVDKDIFTKIKEHNFVNRFIADQKTDDIAKDIKLLDKNIKKYSLRSIVKEEYDSKIVFENYLKILSDSQISNNDYFKKIYDDIKDMLAQNDEFAVENFYSSSKVYYIIKKYLKNYTINQNMLDCFNYWDLKLEVLNSTYNTTNLIEIKNRELKCQIRALEEANQKLQDDNRLLKNSLNDALQRLNDFEYRFNQFINKRVFRIYRKVKNIFKKK